MKKIESGLGKDKPESKDSGDTPYMVKWDLTDVSPAYVLYECMVKWYYYYNNYLEKSRESREKVKGLLTTMASPYGSLVLYHFWIYGATTTKELIRLYKISKQTLNLILLKLERLGFIKRAREVNRHKGKSGQASWIYLLSIADSQAAIDAQLRYNEIRKQEQREKRERRKERRRLAAEERRREAEAQAHLEGTMIQTLVTEFLEHFENTRKPVSYVEIERRARKAGINEFMKVAIEMEERSPSSTGYYKDGKLDPTILPPEIKRIREARG